MSQIDAQRIFYAAANAVAIFASSLDVEDSEIRTPNSLDEADLVRFLYREANNPNHFAIMARIHDQWLVQQLKAGWGYGENLNEDPYEMQDPMLLPFSQLPVEYQQTAMVFRQIVLNYGAFYSGN